MGKKTLTTSTPQNIGACVHWEREGHRVAERASDCTDRADDQTTSQEQLTLASALHIIKQMLEER
jgi:hypothetical protein